MMELVVCLASEDLEQLRMQVSAGAAPSLSEHERAQVRLLLQSGEGTTDAVKSLGKLLQSTAHNHRLHEIIDRAKLKLPEPAPPPPRNPALMARLEKLKRAQEDRDYKRMTQNVDAQQYFGKKNTMHEFGKEVKSMNRQLVAVLNTVITVAAAFAFGYYGVYFTFPMDFAVRVMVGLVVATLVFFADLYFIVKNMDFDDLQLDTGERKVKTPITVPVAMVTNEQEKKVQ